jgi:hypothetical protein
VPGAPRRVRQPPAVRHHGHAQARGPGYIVGIYDKDAGANNQRLYLNGARVTQMSDTLPIDLNSNPLGIGRHVSGIADPFNGHIDEFRIAHVQRSDGWIETTSM